MQDASRRDRQTKPLKLHALGPKLSSSLQDSPAAFLTAPLLLLPIALGRVGVLVARRPHKQNRCGFVRRDARSVFAADIPAGCKRSAGVDIAKVGKSVGSSGNTGSNSCSVLVLLWFVRRTFEQNTSFPRIWKLPQSYRVFYLVPAVAVRRWLPWLRLKPIVLAPLFSPVLTGQAGLFSCEPPHSSRATFNPADRSCQLWPIRSRSVSLEAASVRTRSRFMTFL